MLRNAPLNCKRVLSLIHRALRKRAAMYMEGNICVCVCAHNSFIHRMRRQRPSKWEGSVGMQACMWEETCPHGYRQLLPENIQTLIGVITTHE